VVHAFGNVTEVRTLSPVPDWLRNCLAADTLVDFGDAELEPQAAATVARSAKPVIRTTIREGGVCDIVEPLRWDLKLWIFMNLAFRCYIVVNGSHPMHSDTTRSSTSI
jgi:hypothetical protein